MIRSGNLLKIPLPAGLGFAFAQIVNLLEFNPNARYPILIRVFNYRSETLNNDINDLANRDLILCPILIAGILPALKKGGWSVIGNVPLLEKNKQIPDYKHGEPDEQPKEWFFIEDADISKKTKIEYDKIKHLEPIGAKGSELISTKIAMALLHDEGKKIENYFKLEQYFERQYYKEVMEIAPYYRQPMEIRGKAIK